MHELIQRLETVVLKRNPALAGYFQPGLNVEKIKKQLASAEIEGAIAPVIELYSWKNGCFFRGRSEAFELGLVPPIPVKLTEELKNAISNSMGITHNTISVAYHLVELKKAVIGMQGFKEYAQHQPRLSVLVGRYFPFLSNGSSGRIALDINPAAKNRVVVIETDEEKDNCPLREGYGSFEEFLQDAIRANETNEPLLCLRSHRRPITGDATTESGAAAKQDVQKESDPKKIPATENPFVLRTDFSNETAWNALCKILQVPEDEFAPDLDFVSDRAFAGVTAAQVPSLVPKSAGHTFALLVDGTALSAAGNPVIVIDLSEKPGRSLRVVASALADVANNLSIANMDFEEFASAVDQDGVFRGFKRK